MASRIDFPPPVRGQSLLRCRSPPCLAPTSPPCGARWQRCLPRDMEIVKADTGFFSTCPQDSVLESWPKHSARTQSPSSPALRRPMRGARVAPGMKASHDAAKTAARKMLLVHIFRRRVCSGFSVSFLDGSRGCRRGGFKSNDGIHTFHFRSSAEKCGAKPSRWAPA